MREFPATSEAVVVARSRLPIDAVSGMMRCARNAPLSVVAKHAGRKVRPKHKGRWPEFFLALAGIPRGAKFRPPALVCFLHQLIPSWIAVHGTSGRLPVDHHCNTRNGAKQ